VICLASGRDTTAHAVDSRGYAAVSFAGAVHWLHPVTYELLRRSRGQSRPELVRWLVGELRTSDQRAMRGVDWTLRVFEDLLRADSAAPRLVSDGRPFPGGPPSRRWRNPAPLFLIWLVTRGCLHQCPYCYAAARTTDPREDLLPGAKVIALLDEAATLGVRALRLSGGEPLIHPDLVQVISRARDHGMNVELLTKACISPTLAAGLVEAGLGSIGISLDSAIASEAAALVGGESDFLDRAVASIRHAAASGLAVSVNSVITRLNLASVPRLIELLDGLPVRAARLNPLQPGLSAASRELALSATDVDGLSALVARAAPGVGYRLSLADDSPSPDSAAGAEVCMQGITQLTFGPRGQVMRCDRFLDLPELEDLGNVLTQGLRGVWHDRRLVEAVDPPKAWFADTVCADCADLAACNRTGRCLWAALTGGGRPYGPDRSPPCARAVGWADRPDSEREG